MGLVGTISSGSGDVAAADLGLLAHAKNISAVATSFGGATLTLGAVISIPATDQDVWIEWGADITNTGSSSNSAGALYSLLYEWTTGSAVPLDADLTHKDLGINYVTNTFARHKARAWVGPSDTARVFALYGQAVKELGTTLSGTFRNLSSGPSWIQAVGVDRTWERYTLTYSVANIQAGEADQLWLPENINGSDKYGVILLHGAGDGDQFANAAKWASVQIPARLAEAGIPCVSGHMGGDTFANDTVMSRITAAKSYLVSAAGCSASKIILVGVSMGAGAAIRWAAQNPTLTAAVFGIIPMVNIDAIYQGDVLGQRDEVGTAWGVTYPTALPSGANLLTNSAPTILSNAIPGRLYYSSGDTAIVSADVTAMAAATGWTAVDASDGDHTETTINEIGDYSDGNDWSTLVDFCTANGA